MSNYKIGFNQKFLRKIKTIYKKDKVLYAKYLKVIERVGKDPFAGGLRTHSTGVIDHGRIFSSRVTGDIRVIWCIEQKEKRIILLDIGGHEGGKKVYK
jgi:mRNA-degrading endonuclease YafQ of YafQ-DinJ toxin-antitoxin module